MTATTTGRYGSDAIVDLMRRSGMRHVALNPGASFRGIHDSLAHTPGAPDLVLCLHEAVAVGVAHGYAKAAGSPMGVLLHNVVGLQNASMAIYNAWRDRAPMMLLGGTGPKSTPHRRPWIDWIHTASMQAEIVRDFLVWDSEPHDIHSVPESWVRGHRAATAAPGGPVYLCFDVDLQEDALPEDYASIDVSDFPPSAPPGLSADAVELIAVQLRTAVNPVLLAGFVGQSPDGFERMRELAEITGAAVVDTGVRFAFPTTHPLNATGMPGVLRDADLVIALDVDDLSGPLTASDADVVNITLSPVRLRAWAHDYQSLVPGQSFTADADSAVAALLTSMRGQPPASADKRAERLADAVQAHRTARRTAAASAEAEGAVPLERLIHEVGAALAGERFVLANGTNQRTELGLWDLDRPGQYLGWHSGGGLGYGIAATIGASIALGPETIVVDIQADGDMLFLPSALWTAAKYETPTLFVVNNNRQYGNTVEHAIKLGAHRGRDGSRRYEGAGLAEPATDLAALARSFGVWAAGPVDDAAALRDALRDALTELRAGRPALIDVLTPGF